MNKWIFDSLPSTSDVAAQLAAKGESGVVVSRVQTAGRGRKGRSFDSQTGGLYCSFIFQYRDFAATRAFEIMRASCLAVCRVLRSYGIAADVKWPNDVLVGGKKICGVLIETSLSGKNIRHAIVGIGINVNNALCGDLQEIATSMSALTGKTYDLDEVLDRLCESITRQYTADEYRAALVTIGKKVSVECADGTYTAVCTGVSDDGRLMVEKDGEARLVSAGDVTVREE